MVKGLKLTELINKNTHVVTFKSCEVCVNDYENLEFNYSDASANERLLKNFSTNEFFQFSGSANEY